MPRVRCDDKGLYIKFRNTRARPTKGQTSPLAPKGTHIREFALVEVELFLGDSRRLLVKVLTNGKFNELWYLEGPVKPPPSQKTGNRYGKKRKTKRPIQGGNVGTNNRSRKKVGNKGRNRNRRRTGSVGGAKTLSN